MISGFKHRKGAEKYQLWQSNGYDSPCCLSAAHKIADDTHLDMAKAEEFGFAPSDGEVARIPIEV